MGRHDLADVLQSRRWWRRSEPFPHCVAFDVLRRPVYQEMVQGFREALGGRGRGYLPGHDIHGRTLTPSYDGPLRLFTSRPWHDMLAGLFRLEATGHVNCGLHHHLVGSASGFPHNDLNPGWFPGEADADRIQLAEPAFCDYQSGMLRSPSGHAAVETVRALAVIFYLDNPPWSPGDGGVTGLYRNASDSVSQPALVVPPISNSLLAFECTPFSFHGFISNRRHPRNSIVLWLHRPKQDVVQRWGEHVIVGYHR
jgi:hypothetical protein